MVEVVLSVVLRVLVEKLTSIALKSIARYQGIDAEIRKWKRSLTQIQDMDPPLFLYEPNNKVWALCKCGLF
ncbi:hypothetical protein R6Q57_007201 [Mikania cordata]